MMAPAAEMNIIKTTTAEIWLDAEGIIWVVYSQSDLDRNAIEENFKVVLELGGGVPRPLLNIVQSVTGTDKGGRDYGTRPEIIQAVSALALVTSSMVSKVLGNFFIFVAKPEYPTRLFSSENEALAWLRHYLPEED